MLFDKFNIPASGAEVLDEPHRTVEQVLCRDTNITLVFFDSEYNRSWRELDAHIAQNQAKFDNPAWLAHTHKAGAERPEEAMRDRENLLYLIRLIMDDQASAQVRKLAQLPRTKANNLHKTRPVTLIKSPHALNHGERDLKYLRIELLPCYDSKEAWLSNAPVLNMRSLRVTIGSSMPAHTKTCSQRPSMHIRQANIKPGSVYKDGAGEDYLYMGQFSVTQETAYQPVSKDIYLGSDVKKSHPKYLYVRLTPSLKNQIRSARTLDEIVERIPQCMPHDTHVLSSILFCDEPKLLVQYSDTLFSTKTVAPMQHVIHPPAFTYHYDNPSEHIRRRTHKYLLRPLK